MNSNLQMSGVYGYRHLWDLPKNDDREGNRESMGVPIAEMHSSENWALKRPHPKARKDTQ